MTVAPATPKLLRSRRHCVGLLIPAERLYVGILDDRQGRPNVVFARRSANGHHYRRSTTADAGQPKHAKSRSSLHAVLRLSAYRQIRPSPR